MNCDDIAFRPVEVVDDVVTEGATEELKVVRPRPADYKVVSAAERENVVAIAAVEPVVAGIVEEYVVLGSPAGAFNVLE